MATNASLSVAVDRPGGRLQRRERHGDRLEVGVERTVGHRRAQRRGRRLDDPGDRAGRAARAARSCRGGRAADRSPSRSDALPSRAPVFASDAIRCATDRAPGIAHSGASMRRRDRSTAGRTGGRRRGGVWGACRIARSAGSASRSTMCWRSCTMPSPSAIAWCTFMMNAARLPGSALDHAQLPQRPVLVECSCRHPLRVVEHLAAAGAAARQTRPGVVVVEVDVGIVGPTRRRDTGLLVDDPLVQPRDPRRRSARPRRPCARGRVRESRNQTLVIVDRSSGSRSMCQSTESLSLIHSS